MPLGAELLDVENASNVIASFVHAVNPVRAPELFEGRQAKANEVVRATVINALLQARIDVLPVIGSVLGFVPIPFGFLIQDPAGVTIAEHRRVLGLRDRYRLSLHADPERRIDRRVAIALAVCLDAMQSR